MGAHGAAQVGSQAAAQPLSHPRFLPNRLPNKPFSLQPGRGAQQGSQHSTISAPQAGSQPQVGSQQGAGAGAAQVGSQGAAQVGSQGAAQPESQPPRRLPNRRANRPPFLPQPLSQPTGSQPHAGSQTGAAQVGSQPQVGSQGASQPQAGSTSQQLSQLLPHNLSNRPNALALTELLATIAIANNAGTITRRIVRSPWKRVSLGRLLPAPEPQHVRAAEVLLEVCSHRTKSESGEVQKWSIGVWRRERHCTSAEVSPWLSSKPSSACRETSPISVTESDSQADQGCCAAWSDRADCVPQSPGAASAVFWL